MVIQSVTLHVDLHFFHFRWGQRGWGKTLTLPCLSTGTWQSWSNSEKLLNIIALMKCEDHHTKKLIKVLPYNCLY